MRCWHCHMVLAEYCCGCYLDQDRKEYKEGKNAAFTYKLHLDAKNKAELLRCIERDITWLADEALMDYSLVLAVQTVEPEQAAEVLQKGALPGQPFVGEHEGKCYAYYFGIIDFLQEWTTTKICAHFIKLCCAPKPMSTVEPVAYSEQFYAHFEDSILADALPMRLVEAPPDAPAPMEPPSYPRMCGVVGLDCSGDPHNTTRPEDSLDAGQAVA